MKSIIGWREWLSLPELGIQSIKAKVDTGAKTCALHAFFVEPYIKEKEEWVKFLIHPLQNDTETVIECHARLVEQRMVTDSGGHSELRYVIKTSVLAGGKLFDAEMTLTDRESMKFRMLLGRNALKGRFVVDSSKSFTLAKDNTFI